MYSICSVSNYTIGCAMTCVIYLPYPELELGLCRNCTRQTRYGGSETWIEAQKGSDSGQDEAFGEILTGIYRLLGIGVC